MTKVVILSGGRGSRLSEYTGECPKPMIMVCGKPILQRIIETFIVGGFTEFIIPTGYLGGKVRSYFRENYTFVEEHESELIVKRDSIVIRVVDTGQDTLTGGRILRLKKYLTEPFMMTYGDGLCNINPRFVKELGEEIGKNIITAVHPIPRFGGMTISPDMAVLSFHEKEVNNNAWINAGFMYLLPTVLGYISGDYCNFEKDVLPRICWDGNLYAFQYSGVFRPIDTMSDLDDAKDMVRMGVLK